MARVKRNNHNAHPRKQGLRKHRPLAHRSRLGSARSEQRKHLGLSGSRDSKLYFETGPRYCRLSTLPRWSGPPGRRGDKECLTLRNLETCSDEQQESRLHSRNCNVYSMFTLVPE